MLRRTGASGVAGASRRAARTTGVCDSGTSSRVGVAAGCVSFVAATWRRSVSVQSPARHCGGWGLASVSGTSGIAARGACGSSAADGSAMARTVRGCRASGGGGRCFDLKRRSGGLGLRLAVEDAGDGFERLAPDRDRFGGSARHGRLDALSRDEAPEPARPRAPARRGCGGARPRSG